MESLTNQVEIQIRDNERTKIHKCEICEQEFKTKNSLRRHFNHLHNQKQEYICNICHSGFTKQRVLDSHMKIIHENKRPHSPHKCESCGKSFSPSRALEETH